MPKAAQLLASKLQVPPARQPTLHRPRLDVHLAEILSHPITVVSAPAGFGKTTLLSAWLRRCQLAESAAGTPMRAAWVTVDAEDDDPRRFLAYLVTALRDSAPATWDDLAAEAPAPRTRQEIVALLLAELAGTAGDIVIILDDYHLVSAPEIHALVVLLVEHSPPNVHLVATVRVNPPLPLARWRVRDQLAELRTDDLRFTCAEAEEFLLKIMGVELPPASVRALARRTEGWISGLKLAAASLRVCDDRVGFVAAFSGSHRHVLAYLVEEVLDQCAPATQDFLVRTALLERMCGPLCNAVTQRADGGAILADLEAANLFIVPLEDAGVWYRYHFLFAEMLRCRLHRAHAGAVIDVHRRASSWFEREGLYAEAARHAQAAGDDARAALLAGRAAAAASPILSLPAEEGLKARELEILHLLAQGASNREIADRLALALSTVKWYVNIIFEKLCVDNRTRAVARARELNLV